MIRQRWVWANVPAVLPAAVPGSELEQLAGHEPVAGPVANAAGVVAAAVVAGVVAVVAEPERMTAVHAGAAGYPDSCCSVHCLVPSGRLGVVGAAVVADTPHGLHSAADAPDDGPAVGHDGFDSDADVTGATSKAVDDGTEVADGSLDLPLPGSRKAAVRNSCCDYFVAVPADTDDGLDAAHAAASYHYRRWNQHPDGSVVAAADAIAVAAAAVADPEPDPV